MFYFLSCEKENKSIFLKDCTESHGRRCRKHTTPKRQLQTRAIRHHLAFANQLSKSRHSKFKTGGKRLRFPLINCLWECEKEELYYHLLNQVWLEKERDYSQIQKIQIHQLQYYETKERVNPNHNVHVIFISPYSKLCGIKSIVQQPNVIKPTWQQIVKAL